MMTSNHEAPSRQPPRTPEPAVPLHAARQGLPADFAAADQYHQYGSRSRVASSPPSSPPDAPPPKPAPCFFLCCGATGDPKDIEFAEAHSIYFKQIRPVNGAVVVDHNTAVQRQLVKEGVKLKKVFSRQKASRFCTPQLARAVYSRECESFIRDPITDSWICEACTKCARNQLKRTSKNNKLQKKVTLVQCAAATLDEETGTITTHQVSNRVAAFSKVKKSCLSSEEKLIRGRNENAVRHKGQCKAKSSEKKIVKLTKTMKEMRAALRQAESSTRGLTKQLAKLGEQYEPICEEQSAALRTVVGDDAVQAKLFEMLKGSPVALVSTTPRTVLGPALCMTDVPPARRRCLWTTSSMRSSPTSGACAGIPWSSGGRYAPSSASTQLDGSSCARCSTCRAPPPFGLGRISTRRRGSTTRC